MFEKLLFHRPEEEFWRQGREKEATGLKFSWQKFKWAVALLFSARGVGWNFALKRMHASPSVQNEVHLAPTSLSLRHLSGYGCSSDFSGPIDIPGIFEHYSVEDRILVRKFIRGRVLLVGISMDFHFTRRSCVRALFTSARSK